MTDSPFVPTSKTDLAKASAAVAAGYPAVATVLAELFTWLQDGNWPVAHVIAPFLGRLGVVVVPHVRHVLESSDDLWKYWVLRDVVAPQAEVATALEPELERIVHHPTAGERNEGVLEVAQGILDRAGGPTRG